MRNFALLIGPGGNQMHTKPPEGDVTSILFNVNSHKGYSPILLRTPTGHCHIGTLGSVCHRGPIGTTYSER